MASAVAKRSASWSVMHSDEELARILQIQEEKEYQDHLTAKEVQCKSDHKLARFLSQYDGHVDGVPDMDKLPEAGPVTRQRAARRSSLNSNGALASTGSQNATVISMTDSDTDFSDCFDDSIFDDLSNALQVAREESDRLADQQHAADALAREAEIAEAIRNDEQLNRMGEAIRNDEQLNRMGEIEFELSGSVGEPGNSSSCPIVVSPASAVNSVSICSDPSGHGQELMEFSGVDASFEGDWTSDSDTFPAEIPTANNSLLTSVNIALNVVGSAVNWVSELFSGAPSQPQSVTNRVAVHSAGHAEEDEDEEEEEVCDEDDGWDDEDSDDFDDDDNDDDNDDDDAAFDVIDSDMDDSDEDNIEQVVSFGNNVVVRGRGLVQEEIDVLPTRTFQSRPPTAPTGTAADAGADEHQCQNECQVCLSCFADGEVLRTLPCCHQFHSECIDVWLQRNAICPVCRVRIRDEIGCR